MEIGVKDIKTLMLVGGFPILFHLCVDRADKPIAG